MVGAIKLNDNSRVINCKFGEKFPEKSLTKIANFQSGEMIKDENDGKTRLNDRNIIVSCLCSFLMLVDFDRKEERHEIESQNSMTAIPLLKRNRPCGLL